MSGGNILKTLAPGGDKMRDTGNEVEVHFVSHDVPTMSCRLWAQMRQTSTNMAVTACTMRCLRLSKVGANHVTKSFLYCRHFCTSTKVRRIPKFAHLTVLRWEVIIWKTIIQSFNLLLFFDKNTVDEEEIEKLSRKTSDWWSPNGEFAALHSMNKLRVPFIKKSLEHIHTQTFTPSKPLRGSRILDVGCGGGILSEVYFSNSYWVQIVIRIIQVNHSEIQALVQLRSL